MPYSARAYAALGLTLSCAALLPGGAAIARAVRRGDHTRAERLYRLFAGGAALVIALSMLTQEAVLWRAGLLSWRTGLPLHLCGAVGVLSPFMLYTKNRPLVAVCLGVGAPCAVLALAFPSVPETPFPALATASFCALHATLAFAPILPVALGFRPRRKDARRAFLYLLLLPALALAVNAATGANYLFLSRAPLGTPLEWLVSRGLAATLCGYEMLAFALLSLAAVEEPSPL